MLLQYQNDSSTYDVEFKKISKNVVQITGDFPVKNIGFTLSRVDMNDGWDYAAYTTVYREVEGGIQFSNDGSVYVEPEVITYEPTEVDTRSIEISTLKAQLTASDYKVIKCFEYSMVGLDAPYDVNELHAERQSIRDRINELEAM